MTSIIEVLPLEIIETIIDMVASDEHPARTLKACCLTCQTFHSISQKKIFRKVDLNSNKAQKAALVDLVRLNPVLIDYIQELRYLPAPEDLDITCGSTSFMELLGRFHRLTKVAIEFQYYTKDWRMLPLSMQSSLLSLMHRPSVSSISLMCIHHLNFYDLLPCANVKELRLNRASFSECSSDPVHISREPMKLHVLGLRSSPAIIFLTKMTKARYSDGSTILDLGALKHIDLGVIEHLDPGVALLKYIHSLKSASLTFETTPKNIQFFDAMTNAFSRTLTHLSLTPFSSTFALSHIQLLSQIGDLLKGIPERNIISELSLRLVIIFNTLPVVGDEWTMFDKILLGPGWPSLEKFSLDIIHRSSDQAAAVDALGGLPETYLHGLASSGAVRLNLTISNR